MDNDDHNGVTGDSREVIMHTNTTLQESESAGIAALALLPRLPVTEREGARGNLARIWSLIGIR
jgi:hypothetical protein